MRCDTSTALFLVRARCPGAWLPPDVCGFRLVLARDWHAPRLPDCCTLLYVQRGIGRWLETRPRPHSRRADRHRAGLRHHPHHRTRRRGNPGHPPYHPSRCVASKASGRGPLPPIPRPCVAHQLAEMRRTSVVGSHDWQRCVGLRLTCDTAASLDARLSHRAPLSQRDGAGTGSLPRTSNWHEGIGRSPGTRSRRVHQRLPCQRSRVGRRTALFPGAGLSSGDGAVADDGGGFFDARAHRRRQQDGPRYPRQRLRAAFRARTRERQLPCPSRMACLPAASHHRGRQIQLSVDDQSDLRRMWWYWKPTPACLPARWGSAPAPHWDVPRRVLPVQQYRLSSRSHSGASHAPVITSGGSSRRTIRKLGCVAHR